MAAAPAIPDAVRKTWRDLAARYRFSYRMTLRERLDQPPIRADVNAWWRIGGSRDPTPTHFG
jgi:hypothetical protein